MERDVSKNDARQGNSRRFQWRALWISTAVAAVAMFALYFIFLGVTP